MPHVILGGGGFTGRVLAEHLAGRGQAVLVVDHPDRPFQLPAGVARLAADLADPAQVARIPLSPADTVHHLAARQFHGAVPRHGRDAWFAAVNVAGTAHVLEHMERRLCRRMVYFSTDMVYGVPQRLPVPPDHPLCPLGPYGASKLAAEDLCRSARGRGFAITIFRPRMIVGPGRLGVLARLFTLIRRHLPVPLIGPGTNQYQMVSVFDCVAAVEAALAAGLPNGDYNLGSADPPPVRDLLAGIIRRAGSRSRLLPTPAEPLKAVLAALDGAGLTVLHPEQFRIADLDYLVDTLPTTRDLGWIPRHDDRDMLSAAYQEFCGG